DVSWFGSDGPYADWTGCDLIVQALAGLLHPLGPVEGPPVFMGDHQSALVGGVAAYCAGVAALIGGGPPQRFEVSTLEAVLILAELQICNSQVRGESLPRVGVNRFLPTCPLSIHQCQQGWIGITPITPAQWQAFCVMLDLPELAAEPELNFPKGRAAAVARLEAAFDSRFPSRTADEWAALGRQHKVPMVVVPNAEGILEHPIFNARASLAAFSHDGATYRVPLTPLRLVDTPPRSELDVGPKSAEPEASSDASPCADIRSPLADICVIDFSMGWAGPLATRMLADFGADVIKIEAGRYPDWWRSVEWTPEAIARGQYEESLHFSALNRGKKSVSLDLTQDEGKRLAKALVSNADIVVENQAAGVMDRLGLGFDALSAGHSELIMLSMSAFGAGNAWSDTRAYGSVLEQGSGLPSFVGEEHWPPTMAHVAYGDPIGGIYGAASLLTAIFHQRRSKKGQWINNTQIEAMLPFTTPALLTRQATGREPVRIGNRHPVLAPHGCFRCKGDNRWMVVAVIDAKAWRTLATIIGRADLCGDSELDSVPGRQPRHVELAAAVADWARDQDARAGATLLQAAGVMAAPIHHFDQVEVDPHLTARQFFYEIERSHVGRQLQGGLPLLVDGQRYPMRGLAPFFGNESADVLQRLAAVDETQFANLLSQAIVSHAPTELRKSG
ncbi:MAG: CoA transferase, partial [Chromatiales bacterium]|nr:CoA transferase [Chromatiales bacterium]